MTLSSILLLYICFRIKHFLCDFIFQTQWMALSKGDEGKKGLRPLFIHCGIHATGTFIITLLFNPALFWLAFVDFAIHAAIDRSKALLTNKHGWTPDDTKFWWAYGADQELHNYTHFIFVITIVKLSGRFSLGIW